MGKASSAPAQRLRVTYSQGPALRYISNLDLVRLLERASRRAGLPLAYSGGFNARPRLYVATPLPVGFTGRREVVDFLLDERLEPAEFARRLGGQLPAGLEILGVVEVDLREPALAGRIQEAEYRVGLPAGASLDRLREAVERLLAAGEIRRTRRASKGRLREYDLRPLILDLRAVEGEDGPALEMRLSARPGATGRPEEVLEELGLAPAEADICRIGMTSEVPGNFRSHPPGGGG